MAIEFEKMLFLLKDWPDKSMIYNLTVFAEKNSRYAAELADVLIARIIHFQTHAGLKIPLFYVVDCIMRIIGSPYTELFASHLVEVFNRTFLEVMMNILRFLHHLF